MEKRKMLIVFVLFSVLSLSSIWTAWSQSIPQIYQQSYEEEAKGNYQEAILVLMQASRAGITVTSTICASDGSSILGINIRIRSILIGKPPF